MRRAARRDQNEPEIIDALRAVGAFVWPLDQPVDLLVGHRGQWHLLEVKRPKMGRLTEGQRELVRLATGGEIPPVHIVKTAREALEAIGAER